MNDSKGCGGVMRIAPAGLLAWLWRVERGAEWAFEPGVALAALTHRHPSGYLTGGALAVLVMHLVDGTSLPDALASAMQCLARRPSHEETLRALQAAERLAASDTPGEDAIRELGEGWVAEEALAIAVYAALVARDVEDGVVLAVNHSGDSDSTGAIAGNLFGAMHGSAAIPSEWSARVELRETIVEIAVDLYEYVTWPHDSNDARVLALREKYPAE